MKDFAPDRKEDEVVELRAPEDMPENDGWDDNQPAKLGETGSNGADSPTGVLAARDDDGWSELYEADKPELFAAKTTGTNDQGWRIEATAQARREVEQSQEPPMESPHIVTSFVAMDSSPGHGDHGPEFASVKYKKIDDSLAQNGSGLGFEVDHVNQIVRVEMPDGEPGYLKPAAGELPGAAGRADCIPDATAWKREVAACQVDRLLGLKVVPETVAVNDPIEGAASLQQNAPIEGLEPISQYFPADIDRMAILDYVIGNTDRHDDNYLTQHDLRPAAIDNGYSFPTSPDVAIRSSFVADRFGEPLTDEVLAKVRAADSAELRMTLETIGIESPAINGCIARLQEVQVFGCITGRYWPADIVDGAS